MSLESMKDTVIETARAKAEVILADAGKEAEALLAATKVQNDRTTTETLRDVKLRLDRETNRELERLRSANRLAVLAAKNSAIATVFAQVKDAIAGMSDDEYVDMVGQWLTALPSGTGGVLRVNPKDVAKFETRLASLNKSRADSGKFDKVVADAGVESGAVVESADFTIDCSVGRRLEELRETSVGDVAAILFAK